MKAKENIHFAFDIYVGRTISNEVFFRGQFVFNIVCVIYYIKCNWYEISFCNYVCIYFIVVVSVASQYLMDAWMLVPFSNSLERVIFYSVS